MCFDAMIGRLTGAYVARARYCALVTIRDYGTRKSVTVLDLVIWHGRERCHLTRSHLLRAFLLLLLVDVVIGHQDLYAVQLVCELIQSQTRECPESND